MGRLLVGLLFAQTMAGCGGAGANGGGASVSPVSAGPVPAPPASPPAAQAWGGHFFGTVTIGGTGYYGDAILTSDGAIRLYVGGLDNNGGAIQFIRPESSEQFVGSLEVHGDQASGSGVIIGQQCAPPHDHVGFCGENATGEIHVAQYAVTSGYGIGIQGEIRVTANDATETWSVDLVPLVSSDGPKAYTASLVGQWQEAVAEFAPDGDVVVSVDPSGQWFFQSASSGCVGNGTLAPHLDGQFDVFDVTLTIASCKPPYDYLNGVLEGLATTTPSSLWDYDSNFRAWLSKPDGAPSQAAVTMLAR
jgi:hypothetical protein